MPPRFVLDAFALMAFLRDEVGGPQVRTLLESAAEGKASLYICLINYGEVLYHIERRYGMAHIHQIMAQIEQLPLSLVAVDYPLVLAAAHIKANHRLSYADAFVVALGMQLRATVVTGDPEFRAVQALVDIKWLVTSG